MRWTHEKFVEKMLELHPDIEILGKLINTSTHIIVRDKYGELRTKPSHLLEGITPSIQSAINKNIYFANQGKEIHGNKYGYSKVKYKNAYTDVIITCPIHGEFKQKPSNHLFGSGCNHCGDAISKIKNTKPRDNFVKTLLITHPDVTIISEYKNSRTPILIKNKYGMLKCIPSVLLKSNNITIQLAVDKNAYFKAMAKEIHNDNYGYDKVKYVNNKELVLIYCNRCKRYFHQIAGAHLQGRGCRKCNCSGWSRDRYIRAAKGRYAKLYKIYCYNETESFNKIGITYLRLDERYKSSREMPYNYKVISELQGSAGYIWDLEKKEHNRHRHLEYKPKIYFGGETECFSKLI